MTKVKKDPENILIISDDVDDFQDIKGMIRRSFGSASLKIELAQTFAEGIGCFKKNIYDVCLLSFSMAFIDSVRLLRMIVHEDVDIPVIFIADLGDENIAVDVMKAGGADYLSKENLNVETLSKSIYYVLGLRQEEKLRKKAERDLQESENKYRHLIENNIDGIILVDQNGVTRFANRIAEESFNFKKGDVINDKLGFALSPGQTVEAEISNDPNKKHYIEIRVVKTEWEGEGAYLASLRDIMERKNLEAQLSHAQRLESIGQLAAGIAHEINTPTQYVGHNTQFLGESFADIIKLLNQYSRLAEACKTESTTPSMLESLSNLTSEIDIKYLLEEIPVSIQESLQGLDRISKIVHAMKEFSHHSTEGKVKTDINKILKNTITVACNEWKYVAEVKTNFDPELPLLLCLQGELSQAFLNIIINAAHAIGEVGDANADKKGIIAVSTARKDKWVEIRIEDTGVGIPKEIQNKIFDPFFTTKEVGKGTGQGLPIVLSVITKKHNGTLTFESEVGKGTTFITRLPFDEPDGTEGTH